MYLIETHHINKFHSDWKQIDYLCFISKNLYNHALYLIKQEYKTNQRIIRSREMDKLIKSNENYKILPAATSQQVLQNLDDNIKAFFAALRAWKKDKSKFQACPKFPKYKDKIKGRNLISFSYQQIGLRNHSIQLSLKCKLNNIFSKLISKDLTNIRQTTIKQIRIVPCSGSYKIEVVYTKECKVTTNTEKYAAIDIGMNNLATIALKNKPFIINGRPLKAINQYYNKEKAKIQSQLEKNNKKKWSHKLQKLTNKRNNKINHYLHTKSRIIVDTLIKNKVTNLIIGKNDGWKQDISMGKKTNQNFVQIPFDKFIHMLEYKCQLEGIQAKTREEAYTSKCSALDNEEINYHDTYLGQREKRGMFVSKNGIKINADLNGALNIYRKETGNKATEMLQTLTSRGQVVWPIKI